MSRSTCGESEDEEGTEVLGGKKQDRVELAEAGQLQ